MYCALALILFLSEGEHAQRIAEQWNAKTEVRLWDATRVDILTLTHAYEVDWAPKWAEGIGQSLYYGIVTEKKPGLILLTKRNENRFVYRAQTVCAKHDIKLVIWRINGN